MLSVRAQNAIKIAIVDKKLALELVTAIDAVKAGPAPQSLSVKLKRNLRNIITDKKQYDALIALFVAGSFGTMSKKLKRLIDEAFLDKKIAAEIYS